MSLALIVRIIEEIDVTRPRQLVLLAMAENDGDREGGPAQPMEKR